MENERIKNWGSNYQEEPKDYIWDRIESKLEKKKAPITKTITFNWKPYLVAANVVIILAAIWGFNSYLGHYDNSLFSYNINQKPIKMEELKTDKYSSDFYSVKNIETLSNAYKDNGF